MLKLIETGGVLKRLQMACLAGTVFCCFALKEALNTDWSPSSAFLLSTSAGRSRSEGPKQNAAAPKWKDPQSKPGWYEIPNTQIAPHCPDDAAIQGRTGCKAVISAWNGGAADTKRNRLIIWGGGHRDYFGNEVYGLDLNTSTVSRLTDPSPVTNVMSCPEAYPDGKPSARHTYSGLAYLPSLDEIFVYGGSKSACGAMSAVTWMLNLGEMGWRNMSPHHGDSPANAPGIIAEYDSSTDTVLLSDTLNLFRYDPATNSYKRLGALPGSDYHLAGVIDPGRKLFFLIGGPGQVWAVNIQAGAGYPVQDWSRMVTGCEHLMNANSPGLAYDPLRKVIVGWSGGESAYLFDPDTRSCSSQAYPGGPGPAQANGTFGRFRYFPDLGVFAVVNDWKQNAYLLRLAPPNPVAVAHPESNN